MISMFFGLLWVSIGSFQSNACMVLSASSTVPSVLKEQALIVWDSQKKQEHFIRRADFGSVNGDFGWIVPTPQRPEVFDIDSRVFDTLSAWANPRRFLLMREKIGARAVQGPKVEVLETKSLAAGDVSILKASDAQALSNWFKSHHFKVGSKATQEWISAYVRAGWYFVAFRLKAKPQDRPTVRITFQSDRPIYPYREPRNSKKRDGRKLEIYLLTDAGWGGHKKVVNPVLFNDTDSRVAPTVQSDFSEQSKEIVEKLNPYFSQDVLPHDSRMHVYTDLAVQRPFNFDLAFE